jgi:hypothetical protein
LSIIIFPGNEKPEMLAKLNFRSLTHKDKSDALAATGSLLKYAQVDSMLQGEDMALSWQSILLRSREKIEPGQLTWVDPEVFKSVLAAEEGARADRTAREWLEATGEIDATGLWQDLQSAVACKDKAARILLPVHSKNPLHWTLLVMTRAASSEEFAVEYFDPLTQPSNSALEQAAVSLRCMAFLLQPAMLKQPAQLTVEGSRKQHDTWSCGYWVMLWCEGYFRQARGEQGRLLHANWRDQRGSLNDLLRVLVRYKKDKEPKAAESPKPVHPYLPPPELEVEPVGPGKILQDENNFGCPSCRHCPKGCYKCSQYKAAVYIEKQEAKEKAAKEKAKEGEGEDQKKETEKPKAKMR